jgi:voltage-gated potassium channel
MSQPAFDELKALLVGHRGFMLRLLENQTLLEHEQFTDLLWASFHLAEELTLRGNYQDLPEPDREHLALDAKRVYLALSVQWVDHLLHLKKAYPFLFSLAVRMNPFNSEAVPVIKD